MSTTPPPSGEDHQRHAAEQLPPPPPYAAGQPVYAAAPPEPKKSWFARHKFLTALLALGLVVILSQALNGGGDTPAAKDDTSTNQSADKAADKPAEQPASAPKVGTKVRDGAFEFTVTKVETGLAKVGQEFLEKTAQGQYTLVHVSVENIGNEPKTLIDSEQKLRDAKGREFSADSSAGISIKGNDVFFTEINPGNSVKGVLVYDMPKDAKPASITLHDSMLSNGVEVSLS